MASIFRDKVNEICSGFPGAQVSDPWGGGHDAWKVGGKMFASIGAVTPGVSVKCTDIESANLLKDAGLATHAPYFHKSWALLPVTTPADDLHARLQHSYKLIRGKLPVKVRNALASLNEDGEA